MTRKRNKYPLSRNRDDLFFVEQRGDRVAVLRPDSPDQAIRLANEARDGGITEAEFARKVNEMMLNVDHRYVGLLAYFGDDESKQIVVDESGQQVDEVMPGDSLIPYEQAVAAMAASLGPDRVN